MSVDQILNRYTAKDAEPDGGETIDDLGGYGLLRGIRDRAFALELRKKDDTVLAVPYTLIEQFHFCPTEGITLRAAGREIRIRGKYLNETSAKPLGLFTALTRQRVTWVTEQSRLGTISVDAKSQPSDFKMTTIESIFW